MTNKTSNTMKQLYKNKREGMIFGVCAGLSNYLGISASLIRISFIFAAIFSGSIFFWVYLVLGIFLPLNDE